MKLTIFVSSLLLSTTIFSAAWLLRPVHLPARDTFQFIHMGEDRYIFNRNTGQFLFYGYLGKWYDFTPPQLTNSLPR